MGARPLLEILARALNEVGLDAILIGNAFHFRKTPRNLQRLKALAKNLDAVLMRPYYPASELFHLVREEDGLRADFMAKIGGVKSLESLRARSEGMNLGASSQRVATLASMIQSKRAALVTQERPSKGSSTRKEKLAALKVESDRVQIEMIRTLLDKPMEERTHFLRKRVGFGSCL